MLISCTFSTHNWCALKPPTVVFEFSHPHTRQTKKNSPQNQHRKSPHWTRISSERNLHFWIQICGNVYFCVYLMCFYDVFFDVWDLKKRRWSQWQALLGATPGFPESVFRLGSPRPSKCKQILMFSRASWEGAPSLGRWPPFPGCQWPPGMTFHL